MARGARGMAMSCATRVSRSTISVEFTVLLVLGLGGGRYQRAELGLRRRRLGPPAVSTEAWSEEGKGRV